jgi:hypothetical protein
MIKIKDINIINGKLKVPDTKSQNEFQESIEKQEDYQRKSLDDYKLNKNLHKREKDNLSDMKTYQKRNSKYYSSRTKVS